MAYFAASEFGPQRTQRTQRDGVVANFREDEGARFGEVSFENGPAGLPDF
jgi:hypothetical protein